MMLGSILVIAGIVGILASVFAAVRAREARWSIIGYLFSTASLVWGLYFMMVGE